MLIFRVPRDPPSEISFPDMVLDNPAYVIGSFEGFVTSNTDYATWFSESSTRPIINDCPVSGGRIFGGIASTRRASEARLMLHVETLQARVRDLESATATKEGYM